MRSGSARLAVRSPLACPDAGKSDSSSIPPAGQEVIDRGGEVVEVLESRRDVVEELFEVNGEIIVDQDVAQPRDRLPSDLWMFPLVSLVHALRRLAENLEVPKDSVLKRARSEDGLTSLEGVFLYPSNTLEDVFNVCWLRFHSGTASRRTASRISGLRDR